MTQIQREPSRRAASTRTPLWVKVFGIATIVLIVLFVFLHLTGHGMQNMHGANSKSMGHMEHNVTPP